MLLVDGVVHDVAQFVDQHPSGKNFLLEHVGKDATRLFHGSAIHAYSNAAEIFLSTMWLARISQTAKIYARLFHRTARIKDWQVQSDSMGLRMKPDLNNARVKCYVSIGECNHFRNLGSNDHVNWNPKIMHQPSQDIWERFEIFRLNIKSKGQGCWYASCSPLWKISFSTFLWDQVSNLRLQSKRYITREIIRKKNGHEGYKQGDYVYVPVFVKYPCLSPGLHDARPLLLFLYKNSGAHRVNYQHQ